MIGIDRETGKTITGFEQFVSRVTQVMSTPEGGRVKRLSFGSGIRHMMGENMTDTMLAKIQNIAIAAFYKPINGLGDFIVKQCVATRHQSGVNLYLSGVFNGQLVQFNVKV